MLSIAPRECAKKFKAGDQGFSSKWLRNIGVAKTPLEDEQSSVVVCEANKAAKLGGSIGILDFYRFVRNGQSNGGGLMV